MNIFDLLPEPNAITCDKLYRPRALMTREQAITLLAIVVDKPKGTIRQEFIDEAKKALE